MRKDVFLHCLSLEIFTVKAVVVPGRNPVVQEVSIGEQRADIDLAL